MHGGALAKKTSKQKELFDHRLLKASNKRHGGGYSACALDIYVCKSCLDVAPYLLQGIFGHFISQIDLSLG